MAKSGECDADDESAAAAQDPKRAPYEPVREPRRPPAAPRRKRLGWVLELCLLGAALWAVAAWQGRNLLPSSAKAVPFVLERLSSREGAVSEARNPTVSLESLAGKTVLLHFWATWCGVCRQEFAALNAIQAGLDDDEALLTIVDDSEDRERLRRFVREQGLEYTVLLGTAEVRRAYRLRAFPTNYIIGPDGSVSGSTVGLSTRLGLRLRLWWAEWRHRA